MTMHGFPKSGLLSMRAIKLPIPCKYHGATMVVTDTIPVGSYPTGVTVGPGGKTAYVANQSSNSVSVINLSNNQVTGTLSGLSEPETIAVVLRSVSSSNSYTYYDNGETETMTNSSGTTVYGYSGLGQVASQLYQAPSGYSSQVTYGYGPDGNLTCISYPVPGTSANCQDNWFFGYKGGFSTSHDTYRGGALSEFVEGIRYFHKGFWQSG